MALKYKNPGRRSGRYNTICFLCLAGLLAALFVLTGCGSSEAPPSPAPAAISPSPTPTAEPLPQSTPVYLAAVSIERDLIVAVKDSEGKALTGERFEIILSSEATGDVSYFTTELGRCYIVELSPGLYSVRTGDMEGYMPAAPIEVQVKAAADHEAIPDIGELLGIMDASQMPADEMDGPGTHAPYDAVAQLLEDNSAWYSENGSTYYRMEDGSNAVGLKKIGGRLYYFDQYGRKASSVGVDVSCFNAAVNWESVREQGIDFVIVRIGGRGWQSGLMYTDGMAGNHIKGAKNAGLKVGAYFYSAAVNAAEAVQEASLVIEQLGGMELEMPVYIDMEYSGSFPRGRADTLSKAQRVEVISAFCKTVENSGYKGGIYSGESLLSTSVDHSAIDRYSIWIANYTENNALPTYPHRYDLWQFTDRGRVAGMSGDVDINVIF